MAIEVDGKKLKVVESLGFNHSIGMYAKIVLTEDGERMAVKYRGGPWRFWTAADRAQPIMEAVASGRLKLGS